LLATFILWLLCLATKTRQWERHFQANIDRRRSVLSTVFLGRELLRNHRLTITRSKLSYSLLKLKCLVAKHATLA
jgi:hypothetical protein